MDDFHSGWTDYYEGNRDREPRPLLLEAIRRFGPRPGEAVDLGCGAGVETEAMLALGWSVLAVDEQKDAIDRVRARVPAGDPERLCTVVSRMEDVDLRPVDLVWASFSLFFCDPGQFPDLWGRIAAAIRPGGRFAGQLLGDGDTWAARDDTTSFAVDGARALFDGFEVERFDEQEEDGDPGPKHWHVFHVMARRS